MISNNKTFIITIIVFLIICISAFIQYSYGFDARLILLNFCILAPLILYLFGFFQKMRSTMVLVFATILIGFAFVLKKMADDGEFEDIANRSVYVGVFRKIKNQYKYRLLHDYYLGKGSFLVYGLVDESDDLDQLKQIIKEAQLKTPIIIQVYVFEPRQRDEDNKNVNNREENGAPSIGHPPKPE